MRISLKRFGPELYDRTTAPLSLTVRTLKAEAVETLLRGCVTWTHWAEHFEKLRTAHHQVLLRMIAFQRRLCIDHATYPYPKALKMTRCERIETTIRKRRLFFRGAVAWQARSDYSVEFCSGQRLAGTIRDLTDRLGRGA